MKPTAPGGLLRWLTFNLVGAIGMAVQLTALAAFNRLVPGHALYATAAAIELTLLHNFVWHLHYTWRDRRNRSQTSKQLIRFHIANGAISLAGNLALMHVLLHRTHLPLLAANAIAILCCSLLNFFLGNSWAFAARPSPSRSLAVAPALSPPLQNACHSDPRTN